MQQYLPWFIATAALAVLATLAGLWLLQALRRPAGPPRVHMPTGDAPHEAP